MKKILVMTAILFSMTLMAQDVKPTFVKHGDLVKGTFFHDNGKIRQQGFYKEGKLHGEWKSYDTTGKKIAMGQYDKGVKTGKWFFWAEDKLSEVNYDKNQIADVTTWSGKDNVVVNYEN
ncbi:toxin-antitoxin system YwqK family antitoxin [Aquimarina sp. I32.4]|uniref:toxin-antitoxin system YwqK family antitoxin n=1 Tax=Aquimarina sp. I32.4 TaxID=2053903 RepID=UPI000CDE661D|nr:nicotinic acid mononucleotide adenyltransferase [Aquimarina sp. I32.4]